jgi:hypothetical protein
MQREVVASYRRRAGGMQVRTGWVTVAEFKCAGGSSSSGPSRRGLRRRCRRGACANRVSDLVSAWGLAARWFRHATKSVMLLVVAAAVSAAPKCG